MAQVTCQFQKLSARNVRSRLHELSTAVQAREVLYQLKGRDENSGASCATASMDFERVRGLIFRSLPQSSGSHRSALQERNALDSGQIVQIVAAGAVSIGAQVVPVGAPDDMDFRPSRGPWNVIGVSARDVADDQ